MKKKPILILLSAAALLLAAGCGAKEEKAPPAFGVEFLSTGKSDCAVIFLDGLVILSDTADADDSGSIADLLRERGVERIDYIIISHYDKDHIGGAGALMRAFPVGKLLRPDYVEDSAEYADMMAAAAQTGTEDVVLREDYVIVTENGSLTADPPDKDYGDDNNNSVITTLTYRGRSILFMGDARKKRIEEFLSVARSSYDLIKLPHHGDSSKPLLRLVEDTRPTWAVEMMSRNETVEDDLLAMLSKTGTELFLTCDGAVSVSWTDGGFAVKQG